MIDSAVIFGANSSVSAALSELLISHGFYVYGIYNHNVERIRDKINRLTMDELDRVGKKIDYLFIIGSYVPRGGYNIPSEKFITVNIDTVSFLCQKFSDARIIFCSSVSVYGDNHEIISERSSYINPSLYALSKLAGEVIVRQSKSYAICRFTSIYGPDIGPVNFINRCIHQARTDREIKILGEGSRKQSYVFIQDAAKWLFLAAKSSDNDIFLCASETSVSNKDIAQIVSIKLNVPIQYSEIDKNMSFHFNNSFSREKLNFSCKVTIEEGIDACLKI